MSRLPDVSTQPKSISVKDLWKFLTYRKTVLFFTLVLITAIPHRMNDNFLGVYVQTLGGSTGMVGLQVLQGVTFVIFYTASISYLNRIVPEEWKATGMTLLAVLFFGVSGIVGSFFGGWVFEQFGGSALYLVMSVLSGCGFLFSFIMRRDIRGNSIK